MLKNFCVKNISVKKYNAYLTIAPGRRSKLRFTTSVSCSFVYEDVPYESTKIDIGSATPIA